MTVTRREMLAATAAALAAPLVAPGAAEAAGAAQAAKIAPKFFTAPEFALLDELSDLIIPTDAHSPGARVEHRHRATGRLTAEVGRTNAHGAHRRRDRGPAHRRESTPRLGAETHRRSQPSHA